MCESSLQPWRRGAAGEIGLFQIMPRTWRGTRMRNQSRANPMANITGAWEIFSRDGYSWRQWTCKPDGRPHRRGPRRRRSRTA
jgi:hypothetical protein